jgi:hypothetical protein
MGSVLHTNGDYVSDATLPTMTGAFTIIWWQKCNSGEYGAGGENIIVGMGTTGGSSEGLLLDVGISANTTLTAVAFRTGGTDLQSTNVLTGSDTGWVCCMWRHAAGSATYRFSFRRENQFTWTTTSLTLGAQITTTGGSLFVGTDQFNEHALNSLTCSYVVQEIEATDSQALTWSQNIDAVPSGTNVHRLRLATAATATTNDGTGGTWTSTGTLQDDAGEPAERATDQVPLAFAILPPPPRPQPSRVYDVVAPVGTLIAAAGLSSIGWGPSTPLPPKALAPNKPGPAVVAPVGTGTFSLTKFPESYSVPLPPRALQPNNPALESYAPVGGAFVPLDSLGWFQFDASPPRARRMVVIEASGTEVGGLTSLTSLGWLDCDALPPNAATTVRRPQPEQPTGPLQPFVSASTGWFPAEYRNPQLIAKRVEPSAPTGPLVPFVSASTGWFPADYRNPTLVAKRVEPSAPTGPLTPFVGTSTGWFPAEPPLSQPVPRRFVSAVEPVGSLLGQALPQFGWNAEPQARPAPLVPRRVEPSAPVGTPFAIALPSNGWLATDNPRTPLRLGRSAPTDPVGNLLVTPPLPDLKWLATDDPRTPWRVKRAVVVDPVGDKFFVPPALGPYWFVDQARPAASTPSRPLPVEPPGALLSTLSSLGWQAPPEAARAPGLPFRVAPIDPFGGLLFGGTPWADIASSPTRVAAGNRPVPSEPVGDRIVQALPSLGWLETENPRGARYVSRPAPVEPVGAFIPPPAPSTDVSWMQAMELPPRALAPNALTVRVMSDVVLPPMVLTDAPPVGPFVAVGFTRLTPQFIAVEFDPED